MMKFIKNLRNIFLILFATLALSACSAKKSQTSGDVYTGTDLGTGSHTLELGWKVRNGTSGNKPFYQINFNSSDDARFHQTASEITVVEILK